MFQEISNKESHKISTVLIFYAVYYNSRVISSDILQYNSYFTGSYTKILVFIICANFKSAWFV